MLGKRKVPKIFFGIFGFFLLIFLFDRLGWLSWLRKASEKNLLIPLKQRIYDWKNWRGGGQDCRLEEERKLAELKKEIAALTEENLAQKRLLSAPLPGNWQFLPVTVLEAKNEILLIDKGRQEGVKEGMVAVLGETYLGKVSKVSEEVSEVKMVTFLGEKLVVEFFSTDKKNFLGRGLLVGWGLGKAIAEQILANEEVKEGDLVMVEVEGKTLLIGKVKELLFKEGEVFKSAGIERLYQPSSLRTIFLLKRK